MERVRAHVFISGRVQGVYFRASTRDQARLVGVRGWVRNMVDGRVEAVFEGTRPQVHQMIAWCAAGPPAAHVEHIETVWEEPAGDEKGFIVR